MYLRTEKGARLIEDFAEARRGGAVFKPAQERGGGTRPTNSYSNGARSTSPLQPWCRRCLPNGPWRELMRTAVYVRVSTQRQSQAQTIDQQLARLRAHLAAHGEELQSEQIVRDDGYSGASLNRPGLDHLRDAVEAAAFERSLVTTPIGWLAIMCI
ncbi:MAG TPA: recombinase family protein, partial [Gammaproteobacteria bacterium]|nr:recombinase family protein [Gammaproteobacteria bacterium]